jgi:hypothetical protein
MVHDHQQQQKPPKATRYQITHHSQECDCALCGAPLYVGDHVHEIAEEAFCSTARLNQYLVQNQVTFSVK